MKSCCISLCLWHHQDIIDIDPCRKCGNKVDDLSNIITLKRFIAFINHAGPFKISLEPDI